MADQSSNSVAVEDVLMPDIYAEEHVCNVPDPKAPVLSSSGIDQTRGFDPYDTGVFQEK